ncbi:MAG TPA: hypothetical protein VFF88_06340 [Methylocella sp.]|nr:hypothetical protein [Methylocella sp.]
MDLLFIIAGLLLLIPVLSMVKAQRRKMLTFALPRAVEIAKSHGWVSAGRV